MKLALSAFAFVTLSAFADSSAGYIARDEATCLYDLAADALSHTGQWNHLQLESRVYFSGPTSGTKTYTIYAHSTTNSPSHYKLQFGRPGAQLRSGVVLLRTIP